jgi:asparagine synthase (glutamine-hydrolysing)
MPVEFSVRRNIIATAMQRLDSDLAAIPYANSGLPVTYPQLAHVVGEHAIKFVDRYLPLNNPPEQYMDIGSWPNHAELIRSQPMVRNALLRNEQTIRNLPFLDWDSAWECYEEHLAGANNKSELYALLTLIEMPVTKRIAKGDD